MAKKKKIAANYLDSIPIHRDGLVWRTKEDGMAEFDMEHKGFYHFIAQKFFHKPRISHIGLDKYGSAVWKSIDGTNTVMDIIHIMEDSFPEEKDRMLDRVVTFMAILQRNRFISMQDKRGKK